MSDRVYRGCPAKKQRDASKNRSHNQENSWYKVTKFIFFGQTDRF
jgi:hypothetical protein